MHYATTSRIVDHIADDVDLEPRLAADLFELLEHSDEADDDLDFDFDDEDDV